MKTLNLFRKSLSLPGLSFILSTGLILSLFSSLTYAQNQGRWYNVEVLIFKRLDLKSQSQEIWKKDLPLAYPSLYSYLKPTGNSNNHLRILNNSAYVLSRYKHALQKKDNFRILKHVAWSQKMTGEKRSPAIVISGGKNLGDHKELEGYIKVHIARFLHVTSNLWLLDTDPNTIEQSTNWPVLPNRPGSSLKIQNTTAALTDTNSAFNKNYTSPYPIVTLQNKRRMRSKELHYVDHPSMGMMIYITPR